MKKISLTLLLSLALATQPIAPAQTNDPPKPEFFTCIVTIVALGIFAACAVACYWNGMNSGDYSGPTNSPPILPPEEPGPTTNAPATNFPPIVAAWQSTEHLDVRGLGWTDTETNAVTDLYRTTIQTSSSPAGPWTNAYVVTLWQSAYGSTALVEDDSGNPLSTNYARRGLNGSVTNFAPVELDWQAPAKFWRAKRL